MGNQTSATVSFRSIINEVKYGADLNLIDANEAHYSYDVTGLVGSSMLGSSTSGTKRYTETTLEAASTRAFFAGDRPIYKMLFTTELSDSDLASYFNHDDVRFLRRYRPNQLAMILYKCMEQMHYFIKFSNGEGSGGSAAASAIADHTAINNAIRILSNCMPYLLEDTSLKVSNADLPDHLTSKQNIAVDALWRKHGGYGRSVFADDFFFNFFWRNMACSGESFFDEERQHTVPTWTSAARQRDAADVFMSCPQLPPIGSRAGGKGQYPVMGPSFVVTDGDETTPKRVTLPPFVPFAHTLVRLVTDCCFLPNYSLNGSQNLTDRLRRIVSSNPTRVLSALPPDTLHLFHNQSAVPSSSSSSTSAPNDSDNTTSPIVVVSAEGILDPTSYPSLKAVAFNTALFANSRQCVSASSSSALPSSSTSAVVLNSTSSAAQTATTATTTTTEMTASAPSLFVSSPLLWYDGAFITSDEDRKNTFQSLGASSATSKKTSKKSAVTSSTAPSRISRTRMMLLRLVLSLFVERVVEGHVPPSNAQRTRMWRSVAGPSASRGGDGVDGDNGKDGANADADDDEQQGSCVPRNTLDEVMRRTNNGTAVTPFSALPTSAANGGGGEGAHDAEHHFAYDYDTLASPTPVPYLTDLFADPSTNPLAATLCASLVNYIASYETKGVLPFSSYFGADGAEALLAMCGQVLNAFLDFDVRAQQTMRGGDTDDGAACSSWLSAVPFLRHSTAKSISRRGGSLNSFWAVIDAICLSPPPASISGKGASAVSSVMPLYVSFIASTVEEEGGASPSPNSPPSAFGNPFRERLVSSIIGIVTNPFYALHRRISGSQRRVLCHLEFLHLMVRLLLGGSPMMLRTTTPSPSSAAASDALCALKEEGGANDSDSLPPAVTSSPSSATAPPHYGDLCRNLFLETVCSLNNAPILTESLLFFIYNGGLHHKFFAEVQVVLFILRILVEGDGVAVSSPLLPPLCPSSYASSASLYPEFINRGNTAYVRNFLMRSRDQTPYEINPTHIGLPPLPLKASTNADLVALCMCSMLAEGTPRWYLGLAPSAASVLLHISGISVAMLQDKEWYERYCSSNSVDAAAGGGKAGSSKNASTTKIPPVSIPCPLPSTVSSNYGAIAPLSGVTLFELRHAFDFATQETFLKKGDMCFQTADLMLKTIALLLSGGSMSFIGGGGEGFASSSSSSSSSSSLTKKKEARRMRCFYAHLETVVAKAVANSNTAVVSPFKQEEKADAAGFDGAEEVNGGGPAAAQNMMHPITTVAASALIVTDDEDNDGDDEEVVSTAFPPPPPAYPSRYYLTYAVSPLAASLDQSTAIDRLLEGWYGMRVRSVGVGGDGGGADSNPVGATNSDHHAIRFTRPPPTTTESGAVVNIVDDDHDHHRSQPRASRASHLRSNMLQNPEDYADSLLYLFDKAGDNHYPFGSSSMARSSPTSPPRVSFFPFTDPALMLPIRSAAQRAIVVANKPRAMALYVLLRRGVGLLIARAKSRQLRERGLLLSNGGGGGLIGAPDPSGLLSSAGGGGSSSVSIKPSEEALLEEVFATLHDTTCAVYGDTNNGNDSSSAAAMDMAAAMAASSHALCCVFGAVKRRRRGKEGGSGARSSSSKQKSDTAESPHIPSSPSPSPSLPYAGLISFPIALWLSKVSFVTTQQHRMGVFNGAPSSSSTTTKTAASTATSMSAPSGGSMSGVVGGGGGVLFDARSAYMFLASRRFYGEDVKLKIAKSTIATAKNGGGSGLDDAATIAKKKKNPLNFDIERRKGDGDNGDDDDDDDGQYYGEGAQYRVVASSSHGGSAAADDLIAPTQRNIASSPLSVFGSDPSQQPTRAEKEDDDGGADILAASVQIILTDDAINPSAAAVDGGDDSRLALEANDAVATTTGAVNTAAIDSNGSPPSATAAAGVSAIVVDAAGNPIFNDEELAEYYQRFVTPEGMVPGASGVHGAIPSSDEDGDVDKDADDANDDLTNDAERQRRREEKEEQRRQRRAQREKMASSIRAAAEAAKDDE